MYYNFHTKWDEVTEFKEAMSKVSNTVSLLAYYSGPTQDVLRAVTISSLVSVSVRENEEEVLFVLKKDSSFGNELFIGTEISINVLSDLQSNIAQFYGGSHIFRESGLIDHSQCWNNSREVPTLKAAHLVFVGKVVDILVRKTSDIFLCRISKFCISTGSEPLIHYLRRYQSPNPHFL